MNRQEIESRARGVVAAALDHPLDRVTLDASLIDDLGAESIDFLDIAFRLETEFGMEIPEDEIWKGAFDGVPDDADAIAARLAQLARERPGFAWDRLGPRPSRRELPRLITVRTVVDYLERRLAPESAPA